VLKEISHIILFVVIFCKTATAQLEADNWVIGGESYLTFNGGSTPSQILFPSQFGIGGSTAISPSDKNGNLLFFTNGEYLYNKNTTLFPSMGNINSGFTPLKSTNSNAEVSQPTLCIPYPGHDSLYIIFHIYHSFNNDLESPLFYSIVNTKLDNGLGDLVPGQRDIPLLNGDNVQFKLTAALHCNKKDIWVLGHLLNSDKYFSILVTENGVSTTPTFFMGNFIPNPYINSLHKNNMGCIKVSALGNRMAANMQGMEFTELWDFNNSTGIGTNMKMITSAPPAGETVYYALYDHFVGPFGIEFSPSGNIMYISTSYSYYTFVNVEGNLTNAVSYLEQYNVNLPTQAQIQATQLLVKKIQGAYSGAIQVANNGKMYLTTGSALSEVPNPENYGSCGFNPYVFTFGFSGRSIPIFLQSYFRYPVIAVGNCNFTTMSFNIQNPIGVSSIAWDFGDPASGINNTSTLPNPTHIFSAQGSYTIKAVLQNSNGCGADTIRKVVYAGEYKVFLGNDTSFCKNDTLTLRMKIPNAQNEWSNGSRDTLLKVTQPGKYWVTVRLGECVAADTINITEDALPQFTLGNDQLICSNISTTLAPSPTYTNATYTWSNAATTPTTTITTAGDYWLLLKDAKGCTWRDTVKVNYKQLPNYTLGADKAICEKDTLTLDATVVGATSYTWKNGATTPAIKAYTTGTYWCDVNKDGCIYRDSIDILVKPLPIAALGKDTTICEDNTHTLNATNTNSTYKWQDGATTPTYTVSLAGQYYVTVTKQGCISKDTINISYQLKPRFSLGADQLICPNFTITLQPKFIITDTLPLQYQWYDGSSNPTYTATQQGLYFVDISNYCGDTRDQIMISKGLCKIYVPTIFTPNNDGKNDLFKIEGGEEVKDFELTIYNRWGTKILQTKNIQQGWDGTINGKAQPAGAYIYLIQYKDALTNKTEVIKGTVMLMR
jgi:gliding motility-associated-like protein